MDNNDETNEVNDHTNENTQSQIINLEDKFVPPKKGAVKKFVDFLCCQNSEDNYCNYLFKSNK